MVSNFQQLYYKLYGRVYSYDPYPEIKHRFISMYSDFSSNQGTRRFRSAKRKACSKWKTITDWTLVFLPFVPRPESALGITVFRPAWLDHKSPCFQRKLASLPETCQTQTCVSSHPLPGPKRRHICECITAATVAPSSHHVLKWVATTVTTRAITCP